MPAVPLFLGRLFVMWAIAFLAACSGGQGTLFAGVDDQGPAPAVGNLILSFAPVGNSETEVDLTVEVVSTSNVRLADVEVLLHREGLPEGLQVLTDSNISNQVGEVVFRLRFPADFDSAVPITVSANGPDGEDVSSTISVQPGQEMVLPPVGDLIMSFVPVGDSETEVDLTVEVVSTTSVRLADVEVVLQRDNFPEGLQVLTSTNVSDVSGQVIFRLRFPPGFDTSVPITVSARDENGEQIFSTIEVRPGQPNIIPRVTSLVPEIIRDEDTGEVELRVTALGGLNQPLAGAVLFVRLGVGAPAGAFVVVADPVTNDDGIVSARLVVPEGVLSSIPVTVSVDGQADPSPSASLSISPPGFQGAVGGLQVLVSPLDGDDADEVELRARVVGRQNELLSGVRVFFDLVDDIPEGAFIRVTDPLTDDDAEARAIVTLPPSGTDSINVLVSVQTGDQDNPTIQRVVTVSPATEDVPFVSDILLTPRYDVAGLGPNEILLEAVALGRLNELVEGATLFFRLGSGAPSGATLRVPSNEPITNGVNSVDAVISVPEGFTGVVPVVVSVIGAAPGEEVIRTLNLQSPFSRVAVGGLQLVGSRIADADEVRIVARVVDTQSALVEGVPVRFRLLGSVAPGVFLRVTQPLAQGEDGAEAILSFPTTFTGSVNVLAEVDRGSGTTGVISQTLTVSLEIEDERPLVSDIELEARVNTNNPQAVDILARVLDPGRGVVDGAVVSFSYGGNQPAGAQLFAPKPVTSGPEGATATVVFPDGFTNSILVVATTTGRNGSSASASLAVPSPIVVNEPEPDLEALRLISASNTLRSDADQVSEGVTLTAIATDNANNLVEGATVLFSSCEVVQGNCIQSPDAGGAGALFVSRSMTDASGSAEAILTTSGNVRNRVIRVTASSRRDPSISASFDVAVVGTAITLTGPAQLASNSSANFTATLRNSGGFVVSGEDVRFVRALRPANQPFIDVSDTQQLVQLCASEMSIAIVETGPNGTATVNVSQPVQDFTLVACALQNSQAAAVNVMVAETGLTAAFTVNPQQVEAVFNACREVELRFTAVDTMAFPLVGQTINVGITRGGVFSDSGCQNIATSVLTSSIDGNAGIATVYVDSGGVSGAGQATLSVSHVSGATDTLQLEFVADMPFRLDLSVEPATVPVNGMATIRAVVRDIDNNLVKNQFVSFNLQDPSGGSLNSATEQTDSQGRAEVTYTASSTTSGRDAVIITSSIDAFPGVQPDTVTLTVAGDALRISLGTGNTIIEPNETTYNAPFVAIVTDAQGNPAPPETVFRLSVRALHYFKGAYLFNGTVWVPMYTLNDQQPIQNPPNLIFPLEPVAQQNDRCRNEDFDLDGILDFLDGEDDDAFGGNLDMVLTPGNVVSVPVTVPLDDTGTAQFNLTYAQQFANWVEVELRVIASVSGTEFLETQVFTLPVAASDVNNEDVNPPGNPSPFGTGALCTDRN
ncbi:MAG: hypothetical protein ABF296_10415 [Oceanococcaceae bacterium]